MRTIDCPRCGAPHAVTIERATEPQRCARCAHEFALPEPLRATIAESRALIERGAERDRQLDAKERASLASAGSAGVLSTLWLGVTLVPPLLIAGFFAWVWSEQGSLDAVLVVLGALPLALSIIVAIVTRRAAGARRARLVEACAADVSSDPNVAACCYLCGGSLGEVDRGVARCRYCRADNVVDPAVVRRAHERRDERRAQNTSAVLANLSELRRDLRRSALISTVSVVSGPVVTLALLLAVTVALDAIERPLQHVEYALVDGAQGACVARVTRHADHVRLSYGASPIRAPEDRPNANGLVTTTIQQWVGRRVRSGPPGSPTHAVRRAYGTAAGSNYVELDDGARRTLEGLCQAE
jgi:hypothetical protein